MAKPDVPKRGRVSQIANVVELREKLGLAKAYRDVKNLGSIKVGILDYGFDGFEKERTVPARRCRCRGKLLAGTGQMVALGSLSSFPRAGTGHHCRAHAQRWR
ncbi:MAG: hypothetical protein U0798_19080 [Gemmataceae bacterium]